MTQSMACVKLPVAEMYEKSGNRLASLNPCRQCGSTSEQERRGASSFGSDHVHAAVEHDVLRANRHKNATPSDVLPSACSQDVPSCRPRWHEGHANGYVPSGTTLMYDMPLLPSPSWCLCH
jgi:hypothetical protein